MARVTEREIWIRSTDMDSDGIVNNARYFEFFEQARLEHLIALGIVVRPRPVGASGRSFTIAETRCRYAAPLRHRDTIVVQAWTASIGNRSFSLNCRIEALPERTLVAEGDSALVWLDDDGRPTPLPDDVRSALQSSLA
ncbi:MAG: thioesterase family protein [Chloroflexi bacterium]|nr:thioesterase family protein [Chloroflexota bacterium]MDA1146064.1 thioesterase family protein [Chloroflexota bacterium]